MNFPAILNISALTSGTGLVIGGIMSGERLGSSVASAGDINGDGYLDVIVGAPRAGASNARTGAAYVLFGSATGLHPNLETVDGTNGFRIRGQVSNGFVGDSVSSAGDFNGDGFGDLIIGGTGGAGAAYVLFGKASGFPADLQLSDLDGSNGFRIGPGAYDLTGQTVRSGDINGDGLSDLLISAPLNDAAYSNSGAVYVIFGTTNAMAAAVAPSDLDGTNGFRIVGGQAAIELGSALGVADVNGDGYDDILVSAPVQAPTYAGTAYVIYGKAAGFTASVSPTAANSTEIDGSQSVDYLGRSFASAGDVNGDGIEDLIVSSVWRPGGALYGGAYVVFGKATPDANLYLGALDGSNGFLIPGLLNLSETGASVASAGDIDADGYDDLIIGAPAVAGFGTGEVFILYGKPAFATGEINTATLNGYDGFRIRGSTFLGAFGASVSGAGDLNGDGFDDMIVGAPNAIGPNQQTGVAYIIYGRARDRSVIGGAADDVLNGHLGDDQLSGMSGKDRLNGAEGNDILDGGDGNDLLLGGDGADDLLGGLGGDSLFGDAGDDELSGGGGADKLYGGSGLDLLNGDGGNDRMAGEAGVDTLIGADGNDYLDGGAGADLMSGGTGNDVFIVDDALDQTVEAANDGYDIVRTDLAWTLAANIEALELGGSGHVDGTGNADANNLQGNSGNNTLSGLAGVDTVNGNDGDDVIVGGAGNDLLRGGTGADVFVVAHAVGPVLETDQVYDFSAAEGDIIDLSGVYVGTLSLVSAFSKQAGQMTLGFASGITTLKLDLNGDGKVDYQMKINGDVTGETGDWLL